MSIFNLVEFNSFKIFFLIKTRAMMNDTKTITLQTLILRTRRKKKEIIRATRSKPRFWVRDIFARREQLCEFHLLAQKLKPKRQELSR